MFLQVSVAVDFKPPIYRLIAFSRSGHRIKKKERGIYQGGDRKVLSKKHEMPRSEILNNRHLIMFRSQDGSSRFFIILKVPVIIDCLTMP